MHNRLLISCLLVAIIGFAAQALPAQTAPSEHSVLILPFSSTSGNSEWMGRAVQQDLLTDLTQGSTGRVLAPSNIPPAADADAALKAGQNAGVSIVIYGQAQAAGKDVRLTGQVLDVATGKSLGQLKATGPSDDLFHLEDGLAGQVFGALPRTLLTAQALQSMQQQQQAAGAAPNQAAPMPRIVNGDSSSVASDTGVVPTASGYAPPQYYSAGDYTSAVDSYPTNVYYNTYYPSYYPSYGYSYPTWGWWPWSVGCVFSSNFGFCHNWSPFARGRFFDGGSHHFNNGFRNGSGFRGGQSPGFRSSGVREFAGGMSFGRSEARFTPTVRSGGSGFSSVSRGASVSTGFPRMSAGSMRAGGFSTAGHVGGFSSAGRVGGFSSAGHVGGFSGGGGFHGGGFSGGGAHGGGGGGHR